MGDQDPLPPPTSGELDCLAVLWEAEDQGQRALRLSEIHGRLGARREELGEAPPALTTVSTYVRSMVTKGLLNEVVLTNSGRPVEAPRIRVRGMLTPKTRSPHNAYQAAFDPGRVLAQTFRALVSSYPPGRRHQALLDFARALGVSTRTVRKLEELVRKG